MSVCLSNLERQFLLWRFDWRQRSMGNRGRNFLQHYHCSWSGFERWIEFRYEDRRPVVGLMNVKVLAAQMCLTLCSPMDCSPPGSSVHGDSPGKNTGVGSHALLQGSPQPRDQTQVSCIAGRFFTFWATNKAGAHKRHKNHYSEVIKHF